MGDFGDFFGEIGRFFAEVGRFFEEVGGFFDEVLAFFEEVGRFFEEVGEFFARLEIIIKFVDWVANVAYVIGENPHHFVLACLLYFPVAIFTGVIKLLLRVVLCLLFWLLAIYITLLSTVWAIFVYLLVSLIGVVIMLVDTMFKGHIRPGLKKLVTCLKIPTNWYDVKYSHVGNKFVGKKMAGLCYACLSPCPFNSFPKKKSSTSISCERTKGRNMYIKPYTRCSAMMNMYLGKYVSTYDVESAEYNHTKGYSDLARTISKYAEYNTNMRISSQIRAMTANMYPDIDGIAREYDASLLERVASKTRISMLAVTIFVCGTTLTILGVFALLNSMKNMEL